MKHIAVLGCGPTGLLVAHAAWMAGHEPHIISIKQKSTIPGSQHLHGSVPEITSIYPEGTIQFVRLGTAEGYAKKVYNDSTRNTGWESYNQIIPSWNVQHAYDTLWSRYESRIEDDVIGDGERLREIQLGHDLTISTLPAKSLCYRWGEHHFFGQNYVIIGQYLPACDANREIVVYNGLVTDPWYRWSILGGKCTIEYANGTHPTDRPEGGFLTGFKAVSTDCDCYPSITRLGRWSEWKHGVTMHNAYTRAVKIMEEL